MKLLSFVIFSRCLNCFTARKHSDMYCQLTLHLSFTAGVISTKATLNYETLSQTNFVLTVTVSDSIATATSTVTLTVLNINEAPIFNANTYRTNVPDGTVSGFLMVNIFKTVGFVKVKQKIKTVAQNTYTNLHIYCLCI